MILIGDSYTEGAANAPRYCFDFREELTFSTLEGDSGPLFQLGLLKELFQLSDTKEHLRDGFDVVWIIFTGNDLRNLAEERQTKLSLYLNHHQDYFHNLIRKKELISAMKSFHNSNMRCRTSILLVMVTERL